MWTMPVELDVVEVAALAGDELGIFGSLDRGPEDVESPSLFPPPRPYACVLAGAGAVAPACMVPAASRIAATMFW